MELKVGQLLLDRQDGEMILLLSRLDKTHSVWWRILSSGLQGKLCHRENRCSDSDGTLRMPSVTLLSEPEEL